MIKTQTYCAVCAEGLFGREALESPAPEKSTLPLQLLSHLKVFLFLVSGLWVLVLLYELGEALVKFIKKRFF
ncbi:hypothetical protein ACFSJ3_17095 [Corallincola platygyrae]|uniref:Uncharacterized protein n=1 Tax=Corallincola platygyrae TaxID=1193278 RepID=A0ABW4XS82_9GAMM